MEELSAVKAGWAANPGGWAAWADGTDVPGTAYEELLPASARRAQGQFQTPFWAADLMSRWLLAEPTKTLFDPAVGSGRLLFRAFEHGEHQPTRFVGWDIDPLCTAMSSLNLRLRRVPGYRITQADFLLDAEQLDHDGLLKHPPDATIANPPFSRHQMLDAKRKEAIHRELEEILGIRISRQAGLHALFLLRALTVAAPGGRLAFITPAGWLDANYGKAVKEFICEQASVDAMLIFGGREFFFDGVRTTAAITLLRNQPSDSPTRVIRLGRKRPSVDQALELVGGETGPVKVEEVQLRSSGRWSRPSVRLPQGTPLEDIAHVRRGIATGHNRFFVISEARRQELGLSRRVVKPCLYRPRIIESDELTKDDLEALDDDARRWLLNPPAEQSESSEDPVGKYLAQGRKEKVHERYLTAHRQTWYRLEQRGRCEIVVAYMHRDEARFIRNRAGAIPLNSFHVIEPHDPAIADKLWRALNEPAVLRQLRRLGREYGNGLWKIEPGDLRRVRVKL